MPELREGVCPVCNGNLLKKTVERVAIVPDDASEGTYVGKGEVVSRGRIYATTIGGRREVVQNLKVWEGEWASPWVPFCKVSCAAQHGVAAWAAGFTDGSLAAIPAPENGREIAEGLQAILEAARGAPGGEPQGAIPAPMPTPPPPPPPVLEPEEPPREEPEEPPKPTPYNLPKSWRNDPEVAEAMASPYQPGDKRWHPPGKPPPVPGEFYYGPSGRIVRVNKDPEVHRRRQEKAADMRAKRAAKLAAAAGPRLLAAPERVDATATPAPEAEWRKVDQHPVPPPTPEVQKALAAPDSEQGTTKLTRARELRFRQLWPDLRFSMKTICYELNRLPGKPYAGPTSMTQIAMALRLPTSRIDAYATYPVRGNHTGGGHNRPRMVIDHAP